MSGVGIRDNYNSIEAPPRAAAERELREGQTYRGRVTGFSEGDAVISFGDRQVVAAKEMGLRVGEEISLQYLRREADGRLVFKLLTGEGEKTAGLRQRSRDDLLRGLGLSGKAKETGEVLGSFMRFGFGLDPKKIEAAARDLARISAKPEFAVLMKGAAREFASDAAALLRNAGIRATADSLALGASMLSMLEGFSGDFSKLFALAPATLSAELLKLAPELDKKDRRVGGIARRAAAALAKAGAGGGSGLAAEIGRALLGGAAESVGEAASGAGKAGGRREPALRDLVELRGYLGRNGGEIGGEDARRALDSCMSLLENYAMLGLYGELSGRIFSKLPYEMGFDRGEALVEYDPRPGPVAAVDLFLNMTRMGAVRVSLRKTDTALGICLFAADEQARAAAMKAYGEVRGSWSSGFGVPHTFSAVVARGRDMLPGFLRTAPSHGAGSEGVDASV